MGMAIDKSTVRHLDLNRYMGNGMKLPVSIIVLSGIWSG